MKYLILFRISITPAINELLGFQLAPINLHIDVNAWNNLSNLIKASPSISIFMKRYTNMFRVNVNSIFKINNPDVVKLLTSLRVGLIICVNINTNVIFLTLRISFVPVMECLLSQLNITFFAALTTSTVAQYLSRM